ncbi:MAG TPA: ribonuclease H-like domain-containing protein [Planctomycetota bacterium]|nr:ribonuclease H-like domain-containing protein [Planctomycetota bacterium]
MNESREEFDARLRRSLGGAARKAIPAQKPTETLPDWFLRRASRGTSSAASVEASPTGHPRTRGMPQGIETQSNARGSFGARVEQLAIDHVHGNLRLDEVFAARGAALALLTGDASLEAFDPREATFLDIETTGLSGGAGTQVFQIGLLEFDGRGFELWQGFLRSPDEAPALLEACAQRVARRGALVSFFGKTFDRHRLEDQMRLHRVEPPFAGRAHLDLYHPCRRLYGKAFEDARLATLERELCGVVRERDLSGAFAPAAWFDFQGGREHLLEAVFMHNRLDVLSLAGLCAHVARVLDGADAGSALGGPTLSRSRALAELFTKRRDWPRVLEWSERALAEAARDPLALACRGRALERTARFEEASAAFTRLAEVAEDGLAAEALGELAQLALRRGAIEDALRLCEAADQRSRVALTGSRSARLAQRTARVRSQAAKRAAKERATS